MLESFVSDKFTYKKIPIEEQKARGILGRLTGVIADTKNPTRNGRSYSYDLWKKVFDNDIMKEKIANRCVFSELGHPVDREEIDLDKVCACLAEQPKIGDDGKLYGVFDILDTNNGRILKTLCDYGTTVGVSSRGTGDLYTDENGNEAVDPDTYNCECFDIVVVPAVKEARLQYVTESLDKKRYNKTLRQSLTETLDNAAENDRKIMEDTLNNLGINLEEEVIQEDVMSYEEAKEYFNKKGLNLTKEIYDDIISLNSDEPEASEYIDDQGNDTRTGEDKDVNSDSWKNESVIKEEYIDYDGWDPADIELHKNTDWAARNYNMLPVPEDSFDGEAILYTINGKPEHEKVKFIKYIWPNPIYTPYYAPENKPFNGVVGPMYDGRKHNGYDIHDRYEDTATYDMLSEEVEKPVKEVSEEELEKIIDEREPRGLFYTTDDGIVAVDNSTGDAWTEEFSSVEEAISWLKDEMNERLISTLRKSQGIEEACNNEGCTDKEESEEVVNDKSEKELVAEFQESLKTIKQLDEDKLSLKEQLSVCIAKEKELEEQLANYKEATINLSDAAKEVKPLKESLGKKDIIIKNSNIRIKNLTESVKKKTCSLTELTESKNQLDEQVKSLNENLENISKQLENSKQLVEKYRKSYTALKENFIDAKSKVYGIKKEDLKKNLGESYKLKDVDSICEKLVKQRNKLDKLPIRIGENTQINFSNTKDSLVEGLNNRNEDDFVSDLLKSMVD